MAERSEVLRVQNDALLSEYHNLIGAQIRRIDEALAVLSNEQANLIAERQHLLRHLPPPVEEKGQPGGIPSADPLRKEAAQLNSNKAPEAMPKFLAKGPAT